MNRFAIKKQHTVLGTREKVWLKGAVGASLESLNVVDGENPLAQMVPVAEFIARHTFNDEALSVPTFANGSGVLEQLTAAQIGGVCGAIMDLSGAGEETAALAASFRDAEGEGGGVSPSPNGGEVRVPPVDVSAG